LKDAQPEAWREGHFRLYQHFKREENLKEENPQAIDNLYLAIHHGCKAGYRKDAFDELVWKKMSAEFALKRVNARGAGARDEMTLRYFVPDPFDSEPQCTIDGFDGERKGRLFLWAAVVLYVLGRVPTAVKFAEHARGIFEKTQGSHARLGFWCTSAYLSWFLAASGELDRAVELAASCIRGVEEDLHDEPMWKKIALCLHGCMLSYRGEFDEALKQYREAMTKKCNNPDGFEVVLALLSFHYACLLLKKREPHKEEVKLEAQKLNDAATDNPTLGFLGNQVLARMELAIALEWSRKDCVANRKNPLSEAEEHLARAEEHFAKGKDYLNLDPAYDQTIVNALFMSQFYRIRGDLEEAANHLKRAEEIVGPFVLLNMDCLLERGWLFLAQFQTEKTSEKLNEVSSLVRKLHSLVEKHGYKCIEMELKDLEHELEKAQASHETPRVGSE
jgi:tetratricopeptide (TPR) repeat protein